MADQVAAAESALIANHLDERVTMVDLADTFDVHINTVRVWLKRVREQWAKEASNARPEVRNERRGEMRAILRAYMVQCAKSDDMQNAAKFCKLLIDFDALNEVQEIRINGRVHHEVNLKGRSALEGYLLRKVA